MTATSEAIHGLASALKSGVSDLVDSISSGVKSFASKSLNGGDLMGILKDPSKGGFIGRAAAFGAAGAATGMATHAATGILGAPFAAAGVANNDLSVGGFLGAGAKGAAFGMALGAGGFNAQGEMRSGIKNIFQAAGAGASESQFNKAINKLGGESAEGIFGQISDAMSAGRTMAIQNQAARSFGEKGAEAFAENFANRTTGGSLFQLQKEANAAYNETASLFGKKAYGESFMDRARSTGSQLLKGNGAMSGVGALTAAGGFVNTMYSSNALGVSIPSNYGYR